LFRVRDPLERSPAPVTLNVPAPTVESPDSKFAAERVTLPPPTLIAPLPLRTAPTVPSTSEIAPPPTAKVPVPETVPEVSVNPLTDWSKAPRLSVLAPETVKVP
jgi:hypothetical protein